MDLKGIERGLINWITFVQVRSVARSCEHGKESLSSIKCGVSFD
jgi:hypothetical protein